ncbi:hypothetical protein TNCV_4991461 [Trichonephila clavipes]|nr:hypothetical protein TNCV_4991461 [Trichonephila clavipes]
MTVRSATNKPMTSALNIANELLSSCNVSVSTQTVRNVLHSAGLKARTPRKKPCISEVNRKRRLEFAMNNYVVTSSGVTENIWTPCKVRFGALKLDFTKESSHGTGRCGVVVIFLLVYSRGLSPRRDFYGVELTKPECHPRHQAGNSIRKYP